MITALNLFVFNYLLIFIVILLLKRNIWAIINNYITRATGLRVNWLALSLLVTSLLATTLAALTAAAAVTDIPALYTLQRVLPIPIFLLWTALYVFLGLETYNMYWRIPLRRLLRTPDAWLLTLLMVIGALIVYQTLTESPQLSGYVLAAINGITFSILLFALGLLPVVRTAKWGTPPLKSPDYFEDMATGVYDFHTRQSTPYPPPWKRIQLDPEYGGNWLVTGDLTGDGQVEIVSAQNADRFDNHHTTTICAQRLDGTVLWRWGDPNAGKKGRSFDVACQIYDWRGSGENNVILLTDRELIELDGRQGTVLRSRPIPRHASDMLMFVNVSGKDRATDILIKDRYHRLWVYDEAGDLLWSVRDPGGYMLAHQPLAFDLDGDGRDEILAGFALLNHDGSIRWVHESSTVKLWFGGHLDSAHILRLDPENPENTRIVITYCDACGLAILDGNGRQLWEITGRHFETISAARLLPDRNELQLVVDVSHLAMDEPGECWVLSEAGEHLATLRGSHRSHPAAWLGNGRDQLLFVPSQETDAKAESALIAINTDFYLFQTGDITGSGARDALLIAGDELLIYANPKASPHPSLPLGSSVNFSTYNSRV